MLNLDIRNPLFPMLSSLFGTAGLLISFKDKIKIPKQEICKLEVDKNVPGDTGEDYVPE